LSVRASEEIEAAVKFDPKVVVLPPDHAAVSANCAGAGEQKLKVIG
jgi:hypothetical protein